MAGELSNLQAPEGANRRSKHKGRGIGSGNGKTAGRGVKGQKARKSGNVRPGFEGGSMPLQRRLPKRGFSNHFEKDFAEVRVVHLNRFPEGTVVDEAMLKEAGLAKGRIEGVKIIGHPNLAATLPADASLLYARNLQTLLLHLAPKAELKLDFDDEITAGAVLTHQGEVRHAPTRDALAANA